MLIRWLYTLLLACASPFLLYSLFKKKEGKPSVGNRWREHFGITPPLESSQRPIWIHAASVGETLAVTPLIKALKARYPDTTVLLTTTTSTGAEQAARLSNLVCHRYTPVDFTFAIKRFIRTIQPSQMIIVETELWPNTLNEVSKSKIPVTLLNARLSEKSYNGYRKIFPLIKPMTRQLSKVLCQFDADAERFIRLGVDENHLTVTGSIKFDITITDSILSKGNQLRTQLGQDRPVWIAASTHEGEDEVLLSIHKQLLRDISNALLIVVPRHPERFKKVTKLSASMGLSTVTRSSNSATTTNTQVYVGDTMGEMLTLLQAADVCFMGGSLVGKKVGGHNLLEPAALGKPTVTGPSYYNFTDITHALEAVGACIITQDNVEITNNLKHWLTEQKSREMSGAQALKVVERNTGAIEKTLAQLKID
ncbi:3-deoxy-D-manno-octulosonic acid transferase [Vibrio tubiashii]|nr:3-deoxy-D-manno-octulosonic acid transferase [Vibrio tubiashii]